MQFFRGNFCLSSSFLTPRKTRVWRISHRFDYCQIPFFDPSEGNGVIGCRAAARADRARRAGRELLGEPLELPDQLEGPRLRHERPREQSPLTGIYDWGSGVGILRFFCAFFSPGN